MFPSSEILGWREHNWIPGGAFLVAGSNRPECWRDGSCARALPLDLDLMALLTGFEPVY